jgi:hypothetical protein
MHGSNSWPDAHAGCITDRCSDTDTHDPPFFSTDCSDIVNTALMPTVTV